MNELGERLTKYRNERSLSQLELSELLDVSRQSVSKWETGAAVPEISKLVKMAELFKVDLNELVLGKRPDENVSDGEVKKAETGVKRTVAPLRGLSVAALALGVGAAILALYSYAFNGFEGEFLLHFLPFVLCALCSFCRIFSGRIGDIVFGILFSLIGWGIGLSILLSTADIISIHSALMYFIPYFLCGLFCLLRMRNAPVWCMLVWFIFYGGFFFINSGATINVLLCIRPEWPANIKPAVTSWVLFALFTVITASIVSLYKNKLFIFSKRKNLQIACLGALALVIKCVAWKIYPILYLALSGCKRDYFYATFTRLHEMPRYLIDVGLTAAVIVCLVPTFYWILSLKKK